MNEGKISCEDGLEVVKAFEDTLAAMQSKFPRRDLVVEVCEREKSRWIAGRISVYDKSIGLMTQGINDHRLGNLREVMDSVHIKNMGFGLRGLRFALCKQII